MWDKLIRVHINWLHTLTSTENKRLRSVNILGWERVLTYKRVRMLSLSIIELGSLRLGLRLDLKRVKKVEP